MGGEGPGGAASGAALSGEGRRACGLKWPRSAAGVGSAMRQGLTPPKGMLGKGKAKLHRENLCGGGGQRRAAAGSAPPAGPGAGGEQRGNLENALCARLDSVISEGGSWGWFPLPPPPGTEFLGLCPGTSPFARFPRGGCPFPPLMPWRGMHSTSHCSWSCSELSQSQGLEKRNNFCFG